jgi:N,N'-diacetyllegionaminate synthase
MNFARQFQLGRHTVGDGRRTLIIAEAGVNHDGRTDRAEALVRAAARAGADVVKFQAFRADRLVTQRAGAAEYQRRHAGSEAQYEMLRQLELGEQTFRKLAATCRGCSVEFLATPFSVEDVHMLVSLGVPAIKLASTDLTNAPLLEAAAVHNLPLLLSTGTCEPSEIEGALDRLQASSVRNVVLLHCVSAYPTPPGEANVRRVRSLAERFGTLVGFSDHTEEETTGALAVACSACVVEKHITLDRALPGPDHFFALEPDAFGRYVAAIRQAERMLGGGDLDPRPIEAEARRLARRGVVAARSIAAGEALTAAALTCKRPAGPIEPHRMTELIGRRARKDIAPDEPLDWSMVE